MCCVLETVSALPFRIGHRDPVQRCVGLRAQDCKKERPLSESERRLCARSSRTSSRSSSWAHSQTRRRRAQCRGRGSGTRSRHRGPRGRAACCVARTSASSWWPSCVAEKKGQSEWRASLSLSLSRSDSRAAAALVPLLFDTARRRTRVSFCSKESSECVVKRALVARSLS